MIFGDQDEIHLTNQNCINISVDVFKSNVPIVEKTMCTETEYEQYSFSLGISINFV